MASLWPPMRDILEFLKGVGFWSESARAHWYIYMLRLSMMAQASLATSWVQGPFGQESLHLGAADAIIRVSDELVRPQVASIPRPRF